MARKNKKETTDVAVAVPDPTPEAPLPFKRVGRVHTGIIVRVPCPLYPATEDSPALVVGFRVDNLYRIVNERQRATEGEEAARHYVSAIAPIWEGWDFLDEITGEPIPAPNPQDLDSYKVLGTMLDIMQWVPVGYKQALEQFTAERLGPNGVRVSSPPSIN